MRVYNQISGDLIGKTILIEAGELYYEIGNLRLQMTGQILKVNSIKYLKVQGNTNSLLIIDNQRFKESVRMRLVKAVVKIIDSRLTMKKLNDIKNKNIAKNMMSLLVKV
jgi:hypothetical protein